MSLGIDSVMPFGKHKGRTVGEMLKTDPDYCCWLRDSNRKEGKPNIFDMRVNGALDVAISQSKDLKRRFQPWNLPTFDAEEALKGRSEAVAALEVSRELAYAGDWGSW